MTVQFVKATKKKAKLRLALEAPAGYGKTYTALTVARELAGPGGRIAYLDTEAGSAAKYAHLFDFDQALAEPPFDPRNVVAGIEAAVAGGYDVFVVDSLSHFWEGKGGLLDIVDGIARAKYRGDSHRAWKDGGDIEQELKDAILRSPIHVIAAMRTKTDYVREEYEHNGSTKTRIRKAGTKTVQREGLDYEFDLVGRFDVPAVLTVVKTRVDSLPPETIVDKPGVEFAGKLIDWLNDGVADEAIERPDEKDRNRLDKVVARLGGLDGEKDWQEMAEKAARKDFGHGVAALTKPELEKLVASMKAYADQLEQAKQAEPQQELAEVAS